MPFYSQQRLQHQLNMVENTYGDREARELWAELQVQHPKLNNTHTVWLCKWPGSESLCIVSVIYSWRFLSFSKMWKSSLLSSMETYGEAMWQSVQKAQSSLIQRLSMAIQSLSLVLQGCLVASTALFTLPTMKRFLKHQALQRETSFTNSTIIWITGTTLVVATGALQ